MRLPASRTSRARALEHAPHARQVVNLEAEVVDARRVRGDVVRDEVQLDAGVAGREPDPAEVGDLRGHRHLVEAEHPAVEGADRVGAPGGEGHGDVLEAEHAASVPRRAQPPSIPSARSRAARAASAGVSPYSSTHVAARQARR